jgi:hypothetical protein
MNPKRLLLSLVVAFVAISATDYLIHEVWLKNVYSVDAGKLWRSEADMQSHMSGIFVGQFFIAVAFAMLWARIAMGGAGLQCALALGFFLGLFYCGGVIITHAVQPLPHGLAMKWISSGIVQNLVVGILMYLVNPPTKPCPPMK